MQTRKVAIITGSRAEYGLLKPLLHAINQDTRLEYQLVVSFMHLVNEFGHTIDEITQDGFKIDATVDMMLANDTPAAITKSMGLGLIGFADVFARLKPDIVVVLGDRFEILTSVQAAFMARIPVAHIHGGELTLGSLDDSTRHAITKFSNVHFASTEIYKKRIEQLGEMPEYIFNVGALALSNIKNKTFLSKEALTSSLGINWKNKNFLITYHPVTVNPELTRKGLTAMLSALEDFSDTSFIFTKSNADEGGRWINEVLSDYAKSNPENRFLFSSLGVANYLSIMSHVDLVLGNSSSGIIEAPFFKKPFVNIGLREKNRVKPASVIDCEENEKDIKDSIYTAMSAQFMGGIEKMTNPYGDGNSEKKIVEILSTISLRDVCLKYFCDKDM